MAEEPIRRVKKVEVEEVEYDLEITITEKLMKVIRKSKPEVEEQLGRELSYGEYLERAIFDLIGMNDYLNKECFRLSDEINGYRAELGLPLFEMKPVEEEKPVVEEVKEEESSDCMYG